MVCSTLMILAQLEGVSLILISGILPLVKDKQFLFRIQPAEGCSL